MKIETVYPREIRVDLTKESYTIRHECYRENPYHMSQKKYRKMFFVGIPSMKTAMKLLGFPKGSQITIIDSNEESKCWNRHAVSSFFFTGEYHRVGLWLYSNGEINAVVKNLKTGEKEYVKEKASSVKELMKKARWIKHDYLK